MTAHELSFGKRALRGDADADHAVTKRGDAHLCVAGAEFDAVGEFLDVLYGAEMLPAFRVRRAHRPQPATANKARAVTRASLTFNVLTQEAPSSVLSFLCDRIL